MREAGTANLTTAMVQAADDAWIKARRYWELSEAWLYGAAADYNIDPHIDSWPLDQVAMEAMLADEKQMAQMDEDGVYVSNHLGYGLLGFHAVEYMIFETTADGKQTQPRSVDKYTTQELNYLAAVAGDSYDTRQVMLADGFTSILGALFGSVVPTAVYIGHPGWKSVGARLGYSWMNGLAVLLISVFGMTSVMINIVPMAALQPILIYIGILIGSQAFEHVPKAHFPAVILALLPWLADWGMRSCSPALISLSLPGLRRMMSATDTL